MSSGGSTQQGLPNGSTPQTAHSSYSTQQSTSPPTTAMYTQTYPSAQPGASMPTPTPYAPTRQHQPVPATTRTSTSQEDPPPPEPGAVPAPTPIPSLTYLYGQCSLSLSVEADTESSSSQSMMNDLPPPPKVGETPLPPEYYTATSPTRVAHSQHYPPQMSVPPPSAPSRGQPPASTTSLNSYPSYASGANILLAWPQPMPTRPVLHPNSENTRRSSLEHPPGYVQNAYATDMTPDQRFATEQMSNESGPPALGYGEKRRGSIADGTLWESAVKLAKEAGEKLGEFEKNVWKKIEHISGK